jgi:hypothetical protein
MAAHTLLLVVYLERTVTEAVTAHFREWRESSMFPRQALTRSTPHLDGVPASTPMRVRSNQLHHQTRGGCIHLKSVGEICFSNDRFGGAAVVAITMLMSPVTVIAR